MSGEMDDLGSSPRPKLAPEKVWGREEGGNRAYAINDVWHGGGGDRAQGVEKMEVEGFRCDGWTEGKTSIPLWEGL